MEAVLIWTRRSASGWEWGHSSSPGGACVLWQVFGSFVLLKCLFVFQIWQRDCLPYRSMSYTSLLRTGKHSQSSLNETDNTNSGVLFLRTHVTVLRDFLEKQQQSVLKHMRALPCTNKTFPLNTFYWSEPLTEMLRWLAYCCSSST